MSIVKLEIENFKSIKKAVFSLNDVNILVGENGSGKTNVINAIKYFYNNMSNIFNDEDIFDANNKYSNSVRISITYDLKSIQNRCKQQIKKKTTYEAYYKRILDIGKNGEIKVTLIKIKDKKIQWSGANEKDRSLIHDLFPIYLIDSRKIELTDWSKLWEHIGDLVKVDNQKTEGLKVKITEVVNSDEYRLQPTFDNLRKAFKSANVEVGRFTPKQYAKTITQSHFEGNEFTFREKKLQYFSNGTNSFNYTKLLIQILMLISKKKMKIPFIIIDEPEISLHNSLVDNLCEHILEADENIEFLISTHSARLIKNIMMRDAGNTSIYHVRFKDPYTSTSKMKLFNNENICEGKAKVRITDQHASAYFAKLLLAIEGETELELFQNVYLRELFPVLKGTDIINKFAADDIIKEIVSPKARSYKTPIIELIDMDKVIKLKKSNDKFISEKIDFSKISNLRNENYYYTVKRYDTIILRKRLNGMKEKRRYDFEEPYFSITDRYYKEFVNLIKKYFKQYNIIVAETTCEGMLINKENEEEFWSFIKNHETIIKKNNINNIETFIKEYSTNDRLNFLRILFNGKSDSLISLKQFMKNYGDNFNKYSEFKTIEQSIVNKTSGWVSQWLEYFLCTRLGINYDESNALRKFKNKIEDNQNRENIRNDFIHNFKEIYTVILMLEQQT